MTICGPLSVEWEWVTMQKWNEGNLRKLLVDNQFYLRGNDKNLDLDEGNVNVIQVGKKMMKDKGNFWYAKGEREKSLLQLL